MSKGLLTVSTENEFKSLKYAAIGRLLKKPSEKKTVLNARFVRQKFVTIRCVMYEYQ